MNINQATADFEKWLGDQLIAQGGLDTAALKLKHKAMKEEGAHAFLRATFYRWAELWLAQESETPKVLAVGDIHVENFGTWRDGEGRLVWGVNDFDEGCELPYTSDLVRLGVSACFAIRELQDFETSMADACELILRGYTEAIGGAATPFVLAEDHTDLTRLAQGTFLAAPVEKFWKKRLKKTQPATAIPSAARKLLEDSLPEGSTHIEFREPVPDDPPGLGSRGKRRFYAFALWRGARVLREVKPVMPLAVTWASRTSVAPRLEELLQSPNRCPDSTQQVRDGWIVRRLAPDAIKIELSDLTGSRATQAEEEKLFESMGAELAHLHAGSGQDKAIMEDLHRRLGQNKGWFDSATKAWAETVEKDRQEFS
ncbi:MAG: DUF2252 family protein [Deltaproteobacteria bacterium]|nr:DUF2252 family protein [Deltaproteobacteria bacterium]